MITCITKGRISVLYKISLLRWLFFSGRGLDQKSDRGSTRILPVVEPRGPGRQGPLGPGDCHVDDLSHDGRCWGAREEQRAG